MRGGGEPTRVVVQAQGGVAARAGRRRDAMGTANAGKKKRTENRRKPNMKEKR